MYRFRSIENLLGKNKELESQEIYFAAQEQLNDPMEGFLDIFWKGDKIVWDNLLKHYLMCLETLYFSNLFEMKKTFTLRLLKNSYIQYSSQRNCFLKFDNQLIAAFF